MNANDCTKTYNVVFFTISISWQSLRHDFNISFHDTIWHLNFWPQLSCFFLLSLLYTVAKYGFILFFLVNFFNTSMLWDNNCNKGIEIVLSIKQDLHFIQFCLKWELYLVYIFPPPCIYNQKRQTCSNTFKVVHSSSSLLLSVWWRWVWNVFQD